MSDQRSCGVCVNPRTRRACGRRAVALSPHPIFEPTPMCAKHAAEVRPEHLVWLVAQNDGSGVAS